MGTLRISVFAAFATAVGSIGLATISARADYVQTGQAIPPPAEASTNAAAYNTPSGQFHISSFFDVFTEISLESVPPPAPGTSKIQSFFDIFTELTITPPSGPSITPIDPGNPSTGIQLQLTTPSNQLPGSTEVNTQMISMDFSGINSHLPSGLELRLDPTTPSTGQTTVTDIGGGQFRISSFFDVFTDISLDGGQTWTPSTQQPLILTGLPEPGSLALLAVGGFSLLRRRVRSRPQ